MIKYNQKKVQEEINKWILITQLRKLVADVFPESFGAFIRRKFYPDLHALSCFDP